MAYNLRNTNIKEVWPAFIDALEYLTRRKMAQTHRRYVYRSFSDFHDDTFNNIRSPHVIEDLDSALRNNINHPHSELIFLELNSYIIMVDTLKDKNRKEPKPSGYLNDGIGIGKTIIDSLRDLADLSPYTKLGLKIYSELLDILKGFLSTKKNAG